MSFGDARTLTCIWPPRKSGMLISSMYSISSSVFKIKNFSRVRSSTNVLMIVHSTGITRGQRVKNILQSIVQVKETTTIDRSLPSQCFGVICIDRITDLWKDAKHRSVQMFHAEVLEIENDGDRTTEKKLVRFILSHRGFGSYLIGLPNNFVFSSHFCKPCSTKHNV